VTGPPASDASLDVWAAWARSAGRGHLDPARLREEARRLRADQVYGLREPAPSPDVEQERPMLAVDPGPLSGDERVALVLFLREAATRAAAGAAGDRHPAVVVVRQLAEALREPGPVAVKVRLPAPDRELLFAVVQSAHQRARSEQLPVEPAVRRVLAGVELFAYGERGWQPPGQRLSPEHDRAWSGDEPFRAIP